MTAIRVVESDENKKLREQAEKDLAYGHRWMKQSDRLIGSVMTPASAKHRRRLKMIIRQAETILDLLDRCLGYEDMAMNG